MAEAGADIGLANAAMADTEAGEAVTRYCCVRQIDAYDNGLRLVAGIV